MSPPSVPVSPRVPAEPSAGSGRFGLAGPAGRALTIVAIADDPALLDAIVRAGCERDVVITSPTADRFVDQLVANAAAIAVIDAACAPPPLEGFIERIHLQFPQLLLILAGSATLQAALATRLVDGTLFRFAHKPASAQRMQLFIDAARRHLEADISDADPTAVAEYTAPEPPRTASSLRPVVLGVALFAAVFCLAWWHLQPSTARPARTAPMPATLVAPPPVVPAPAVPAPATTAGVEPAAEDPLADDMDARAAAMIALASAMEPVRAVLPSGPFLDLARARLASHDLIEPAGDSALFYVEAAQVLAPRDPEVGATALALGEALIAQTRQALNAGDLAAARRWLHASTEYRINQSTIAELSARLRQLEAATPQAGHEP